MIEQDAAVFLDSRQVSYSRYVVLNRALVRADGVKPVVRRILYTMLQSGLTPVKKHMKAATVAGRVMEYHPHGDSSIEEALENLALDHTMRLPLVDPQGTMGNNFGNKPPAPRYWEARLSTYGFELVRETLQHALPMGVNYSGEKPEPEVLPARFPNTIINGTFGIGVAFASSIMPHNPTEVMEACVALNKNPGLTVDELLRIMPGPDFPTGGVVSNVEGIREYYETGAGTITHTGAYTVEEMGRGKTRIIFHEIPYRVDINTLMETINKHMVAGVDGFDRIARAYDASGTKHRTRVIIETKPGAPVQTVLDALFKRTHLRTSISANMTVLRGNTPTRAGMLTILQDFLDLRCECVKNKFTYQAETLGGRLTNLRALETILVDVDKAVSIIRGSNTQESAAKKLRKTFKLTQGQAEYIMSLQLRRLTRADKAETIKTIGELQTELDTINSIVASEEKLREQVGVELLETLKVVADVRRTVLDSRTSEQVKEAEAQAKSQAQLLERNEPVWVTRFTNGTVLRTMTPYTPPAGSVGHGFVAETILVRPKDSIVLIGADGVGHRVPVLNLSETMPYDLVGAGVEATGDTRIIAVAVENPCEPARGVLLGTRLGKVKLSTTDFVASRDDFPVISLSDGDTVVGGAWVPVEGDYRVLMASTDYSMLVFDVDEVRVSGSRAGGVAGLKLKGEAQVGYVGVTQGNVVQDTLIGSTTNNSMKFTAFTDVPVKKRGGQGVNVHKLLKNDTEYTGVAVGSNLKVVVDGRVVASPPVTPRAHSGVKTPSPVEVGNVRVGEKK